jgi:hypothetical protein
LLSNPNPSIALEAVAIYGFVSNQIESIRPELTALEEEVDEIMNGKPVNKKLKAGKKSKKPSAGACRNIANVGGVAVDLGDIRLGGSDDSDSDDSFELADDL